MTVINKIAVKTVINKNIKMKISNFIPPLTDFLPFCFAFNYLYTLIHSMHFLYKECNVFVPEVLNNNEHEQKLYELN